MKFYNPFKSHIVQFISGEAKGKFAIRKLSILPFFLRWEYLDYTNLEYFWGSKNGILSYTLVDSFEVAKTVHQRYLDRCAKIKSVAI